MKIGNFIYVLWFIFAGFMVGCEDDDSLFSGDENYITSFRLVQGEKTYVGDIVGDSLILAVPESVSFENAVVEFTASENTTLSPDPSTITNWGEERTFTVTSYNRTQRVYKYLVVRTLLAQAGDVVLSTPEEIEAFAARGINKIEGNLTIGKFMGTVKEDTLTSLSLLSSLKEVTGKITINPTYGGTSLDGLQNLEQVGGLTMVSRSSQYGAPGISRLREIDLSHLKKVGSDLVISADTLYSLNLGALQRVGNNLQFEVWSIEDLSVDALTVVGGNLSFPGRHYNGGGNMLLPERMEFPQLSVIGNQLQMQNPHRIKELLFPALTSASEISLQQTDVLAKIDFRQLKEVVGNFTLQWTHRIQEFDFPELSSVGGFKIYYIEDLEKVNASKLRNVGTGGFSIEVCNKLKDLKFDALTAVQGNFTLASDDVSSLSNLKEVGGKFTLTANMERLDGFNNLVSVGEFALSGAALKEVNGFKVLTSIHGNVTLSNMNNVVRIDGFDALRSVGSKLTVQNMEKLEKISFLSNLQGVHFTQCNFLALSALSELDASGFSVDKLTLSNVGPDFILRGNAEFEGEMFLNNSRGVHFEGIEHVQTLTVSCFVQQEPAVFNFANLKKVRKLTTNLGYSANAAALCFPDLEEVEGALTLSEGSSAQQMQPTQFPVLRKVGTLAYTGVVSVLNLPLLESVEGEFRVSTSYQNGPVKMLEEIRVPNLKQVGGLVLTSNAYSANNYNNVIVDLKCFEALESAGYVNIQKQAGLVSFEGLEKVISKLEDEGSWVVSGNGYNPTFEQVKAGELVK